MQLPSPCPQPPIYSPEQKQQNDIFSIFILFPPSLFLLFCLSFSLPSFFPSFHHPLPHLMLFFSTGGFSPVEIKLAHVHPPHPRPLQAHFLSAQRPLVDSKHCLPLVSSRAQGLFLTGQAGGPITAAGLTSCLLTGQAWVSCPHARIGGWCRFPLNHMG